MRQVCDGKLLRVTYVFSLLSRKRENTHPPRRDKRETAYNGPKFSGESINISTRCSARGKQFAGS